MDLPGWKKTGQDTHSYFGSPRLRDPKNGDFRLAANSPVRATGANAGLDAFNLQRTGQTARINMGAYITADMTDTIGIRPEAVTSVQPLTWSWPYS